MINRTEIIALRTIRDFIRYSASQMAAADVYLGHGTEDPIDEAAALVLHAVHLTPPLHDAYLPARLTTGEVDVIVELLTRRVRDRVPLAYLTQTAWFADLPFFVDERVLIPRSPIAELIDKQFSPYLRQSPTRILDLGTGSGCIAIACAHLFPAAHIDASDINQEALEVAAINVENYEMEDQITLHKADVFAGLPPVRYDLIVSNPPYVRLAEFDELPDEYDHEPRLALAAGEDGLDVVRRLLADAKNYLTDDGLLVVEVGDSRPELEDAFPDVPFLWPDFENGGDGVFVLSAAAVNEWF